MFGDKLHSWITQSPKYIRKISTIRSDEDTCNGKVDVRKFYVPTVASDIIDVAVFIVMLCFKEYSCL